MRALVITGPGRAQVHDVTPPEPRPGQVVVDVERAGLCGTDVELLYAAGAVDPRPLVAATIDLTDVAAVLAGERDPAWGGAPKIHVDPRLPG